MARSLCASALSVPGFSVCAPLKCVFNRCTVQPLKSLLEAGLELQFKRDRAPPEELAGMGEFACTLLHAFQDFSHD
jgi:hypothetical protein